MAKRKRVYLKNIFGEGKRPKVADFQDLIDSTFNLEEDGINFSNEYGYEFSPRNTKINNQPLLAFLEAFGMTPLLKILIKKTQGDDNDALVIENNHINDGEEKGAENILCFTKEGHLGVHLSDKVDEIDPIKTLPFSVGKMMGQKARIGIYGVGAVPADGNYHEILPKVEIFQAFEIIACLKGPEHSGKHAITHALAICTHKNAWFNRIRQTNAFSGWPWNRLKLRWKKVKRENKEFLTLQLKSRVNYLKYAPKDGYFKIKYHITQLGGIRELDELLEGKKNKQ